MQNVPVERLPGSDIDRSERIVPGLAVVAMAVALVSPRGAAIALFMVAAASMCRALPTADWRRLVAIDGLAWALLAFGAWLTINALWSAVRLEAYGKVLFYFVAISATWAASKAVVAHDGSHRAELASGLLWGVVLGAAYLAVEVLLDQPIQRLALNVLPFVKPPAKHTTIVAGQVVDINDYVLNRNVAVLMLLLWPAVLLAQSLLSSRLAVAVSSSLLLASAAILFGSEHETSMLALVISTIALAGMYAVPRLMRGLVIVGWLAATLLVVPIASVSYSAGLHQASWIPLTGRSRIILWGVTANEVRSDPLLGRGVASTKALDERAAATATKPEDHTYPLRTGRHSHNIYLQAWYELGAIGAVLLMIVGLAILALMGRLSQRLQMYAHASFVAAAVIGAFSWGMWQTWFMAAYALWALVLVIALAVADQRRSVSEPPSTAR